MEPAGVYAVDSRLSKCLTGSLLLTMYIPNQDNEDIHDLDLLAYFAEQRGWHDVAESLSEQASSETPDPEALKADWQWLFDAFDEQALLKSASFT